MLTANGDVGYGIANEAHVRASGDALAGLARLVSSTRLGQHAPFHVRLGLYEHGGFLSPQLYGVVLYLATGETERAPIPDPIEGDEAPAHTFFLPTETAADHPFTYAVVANHPVEVQIQHTLGTLARLLARQELIKGLEIEDFPLLDQTASESDGRADREVADLIRANGWQAAAESIRARADAAGRPLSVTFTTELMGQEQLAVRAPALRRVYNENIAVRSAVDKLAAACSQGLSVVGNGLQSTSDFARDLLDLGLSRKFLAHVARDAFVCGNGYLSFGAVPTQDMRLLLPEHVRVVSEGVVIEDRNGEQVRHEHVLHVRGSQQQSSLYGMSALEPFISLQAQRDLMTRVASRPAVWRSGGAPEQVIEAAQPMADFAARTLEVNDESVGRMLGVLPELRVEVPNDMYFASAVEMRPTADRLALRAPGANPKAMRS